MRKLTLILCVLLLFATGCEKKSETDSSEQISTESNELNLSEKEEITASNGKEEEEQSEVSATPAPIVTPIINEEPKDDEIIKEDILNEDLKEEQQEEIFWF